MPRKMAELLENTETKMQALQHSIDEISHLADPRRPVPEYNVGALDGQILAMIRASMYIGIIASIQQYSG